MNRIPLERYAGPVSAGGVYGLPSLAAFRPSRRTTLLIALVAIVAVLQAMGVIHHGELALLAAGPVAEFTPSRSPQEKGEALAKTRKEIADLFTANRKTDAAGQPDGFNGGDWVGQVQALNQTAQAQAKTYDEAVSQEKLAWDNEQSLKGLTNIKRPMQPDGLGGPSDGTAAGKARSIGEVFGSKSGELREISGGASGSVSFELSEAEYVKLLAASGVKTLLTSADIAPVADRQAVVPSAQFLGDVTDLFVPGSTVSDTIDFYEETTFTNAAAETAEGSAAPESALDFTLRTFPVQEISTFIPVTRRALADTVGLQSYVEGRLGHMINLRRSGQLLTGNGISPNLRGILNVSGIQTQAKGSDPTPDAVYKAMVLARTTGDAEPTGAVFHALDWQDIRLLRTIDGVYSWGSPSDAGADRLWGLGARVSNSITQNTGLVGGFRPYAQIFRRQGATIEISTEHSTYFTERKAAVLIYERLALAVYRPGAFVQITGI